MDKKLENILNDCFKILENCTEEDIQEMQRVYDNEVGRYPKTILNQEFEILYPVTSEDNAEMLNLLKETDIYTFESKISSDEIPISYNEKDTWKKINFEDDNYAKIA